MAYYGQQGFDASLTDFPEDSFAETLEVSELCENYLDDNDLSELIPEEEDPAIAAAERRGVMCFRMLRRLEIELRAFVDRLLTAQYGANWTKRMPPDLKAQWEQTAESRKASGHPVARPIEAADFTDYERIICKADHFKEVFRPYFLEVYSVQETFRRLRPLRNQTMHAGPVTREDLLFVVTECTRISKAIAQTL